MASCWGIGESAGMQAQIRALAWALGVVPEMKNVTTKKSIGWLPNGFFIGGAIQKFIIPGAIAPGSDPLQPPWPELVISCGRRSVQVSLGLKAKTGDTTKFIHIQDPMVPAKYFDLVVAMDHDDISGPNVIKTKFALHSIAPDVLQKAAALVAPRFVQYPKPYVAVLFGGSTNKYRLTPNRTIEAIASLRRLLATINGSLLITPSRRTGEDNIDLLKRSFAGNPRVYIYDFDEENPYFGLLGLADAVIVTNDSVNMMSEAQATGKPMYILKLPGHKNTKPERFAEMLEKSGFARPLGDQLQHWRNPVNNEMARLAREIKQHITIR